MRLRYALTVLALALVAALLWAAAGSGGAETLSGTYANPEMNGANGDVKIHSGNTEDEPIVDNEPKVCSFHLHGFKFDPNSTVDWKIDTHPPTTPVETVRSGTITMDANGNGRTPAANAQPPVFSLPNGHYKLYWQQHGSPGSADHKVFWVDCPTATPTTQPTNTPTSTPTATPTVGSGTVPTSTPTSTPTATPTPGPKPKVLPTNTPTATPTVGSALTSTPTATPTATRSAPPPTRTPTPTKGPEAPPPPAPPAPPAPPPPAPPAPAPPPPATAVAAATAEPTVVAPATAVPTVVAPATAVPAVQAVSPAALPKTGGPAAIPILLVGAGLAALGSGLRRLSR